MDEPFELSFTENFPYHSIGFRPDSCAYVISRLPKNKQRQVILIILVYSLSTIFLSSANQMLYMRYLIHILKSLYHSTSLSVSEFVCLSVWMFPICEVAKSLEYIKEEFTLFETSGFSTTKL